MKAHNLSPELKISTCKQVNDLYHTSPFNYGLPPLLISTSEAVLQTRVYFIEVIR